MKADRSGHRHDLREIARAAMLERGKVRILVAVADVAGLVVRGSAIDRRAGHNTTSVHTAAGVFSMLHERLSTDRESGVGGSARVRAVPGTSGEVVRNGS